MKVTLVVSTLPEASKCAEQGLVSHLAVHILNPQYNS